jgi:hypothetical protein
LTAAADVSSLLILPPVVRVTAAQGGFVGVDTRKTSDKFDKSAYRMLVTAFLNEFAGKVIPPDTTLRALDRQGITASTAARAEVLASLASTTKVEWIIGFEINKSGSLVGSIYDEKGRHVGSPSFVNLPAKLTDVQAADMASLVAKQLVPIARAKVRTSGGAVATAPPQLLPPPGDEDLKTEDSEFVPAVEETAARRQLTAERIHTRLQVAVGPGAVLRNFSISGDLSSSLADFRTSGVAGLGVYAMVNPLELLPNTSGTRFSDVELEVNYRRAFIHATGRGGDIDGQTCAMTDDDLQLRGSWRVKVGEGAYLPWLGLGGGWSQEQTTFQCGFPVLSMMYRGVDVQLRLKQPIWNDVVALDASFGPRFLVGGGGTRSDFSLVGEAWVEVKPVSFLFTRAGLRMSRLQLLGEGLSTVDTRTFVAVEVGAFL